MPQIGPGKTRYALWGIVLLTLGVYGQTLWSSFHFDDFAILSDPFVTSADGWWKVFRPAQTRPLTYFTFWANYQIGSSSPWTYHLVNLLVHSASVVVAGRIFAAILPLPAAYFALLLFSLHPLQTEAVAYIFARATLLATLFCLLSWHAWITGHPWRAVGLFALALLAKEECVAFPVFLLGAEWARRHWAAWGAMLAASVAAGVRLLYVAAHTQGAGLGAASAGVTPMQYLLTQPKVVWNYLVLFVFPVGQNFDHDIALYSGILPIAGLLAVAAVFLWKRDAGLWVLGAMVLLAPSSSVIPVADLMFEHRMYLPMISLSLAAGLLLAHLPRPALPVLALLLAGATGMRARVWQTEETLWSDAASKSPGKARPKLQLARAVAPGNPQRAQTLLLEARAIRPGDPEVYTQMGILMLGQRAPDEALREFDQALRLQPDSPHAHSNRGTALYLLGFLEEAEREFRLALEIDPCHPNARHNLDLMGRKDLPSCVKGLL